VQIDIGAADPEHFSPGERFQIAMGVDRDGRRGAPLARGRVVGERRT
jgi:hypothetical protein